MATIPKALRTAHLASAAALLTVEKAALRTTTATLTKLLASPRVAKADDEDVREEIAALMALLLLKARQAAKVRSLKTLGRELRAALKPANLKAPKLPAAKLTAAEKRRVQRIAERFAKRWTDKRAASLEAAEPKPHKAATKATRHQIETAVITETSAAFSEARETAIPKAAAAAVIAASVYTLGRRWDSVLDKRTCPVCDGLDGKIIGADDDWSEGPPGGVHPRCRCIDTVVLVRRADIDLDEAA